LYLVNKIDTYGKYSIFMRTVNKRNIMYIRVKKVLISVKICLVNL